MAAGARSRRSPRARSRPSPCRSAFSTQRKAGMSSFDPSRMPAWLAPVCELRSGSHSIMRCVPASSQLAMCGALPSRIARWSTGRARPSISRNRIPGVSVCTGLPCAARDAADHAQRVGVVVVDAEDHLEHEHRRGDDDARPAAPSRTSSTLSVREVMSRDQQEDQRVEHEHDHEAERQRERQAKRGHQRRQHRVERSDRDRGGQRVAEVADAHAGDDRGGDEHRDARHEPRAAARGAGGSAAPGGSTSSLRRRFRRPSSVEYRRRAMAGISPALGDGAPWLPAMIAG